ncbi:cell wall-binding repeat-containing protein [Candidatus Clostridium radicumherbarum]|uniref:Cell wall-binding repeat-containing protein n=1 Tax=Candidatus Clostridium radicumherbarum TaxID=3381662 RepID=A0ABW8TUU0_9CLOT
MQRSIKRFTAIFLTIILIITLQPVTKVSANSLPKYSSTDSNNLGFNAADAVQDDTQPVLYITDMTNKRVVAYNYITKQSSYIQFNMQPEHIVIARNQLYVTLINGPHNPKSDTALPGAITLIDTAAFNTQNPTAKEQFAVDIEPYGITTDNQGYIYISGGTSGYGSEIESYDPNTQKEISSQLYCMTGKLLFNSYNNVIYNTWTAGSGQTNLDVYAYPVSNGVIGKKYEYKDDNTSVINPNLMLSPDGKFLYTSPAEILTCSKDIGGDLLNYKKLSSGGEFNGMAFNMDDRVFYGGYNIYDYDSLTTIGSFHTNHSIGKTFYNSNKLIALTADFNGPSYIETMDTAHITRRPMLISTSIEDGEMNLPLVNDITLNFDQDINIINSNMVEVTNAQNNRINTTATVLGNKLIVKFNDGLSYSQVYNLLIPGGYGDITGKLSGIEYPDDIRLTFSTGSLGTINENVKQYFGSNKWIDGEKSYDGDLFIAGSSTLVINPNSALNVKGNLVVYGGIVNYGTINVSGNIYILNKLELDPSSRQGTIGNLYNTGTITGNIVLDSYPKPFMNLSPDSDTTQNKSTQTFGVITYPGNIVLLNGQVYPSKVGMYTEIPYQLRSGINNVNIGVKDIFSNVSEKQVNINCTIPAPKIISISPDNLQTSPMPVNPKIILKFDRPLDSWAITNNYTTHTISITNKTTNVTSNIGIQVISDENGINDEIMISSGTGVLPALTNFTLNVPYNSVISQDGVGMDKDYSFNFSTDGGIKRLAGNDRYSTSVEISKEGFDTANNIILATGDDFPDALCAAPLARKYNAPILLTNSKSLNPQVFNEIKRLKAQEVYIIGGVGAVSKDIENTLTSSGLKCIRIQGNNRYETSTAIANEVGSRGTFIVATGNDFPDALSIAPLAAEMQAPILLTDKNNIPKSTIDFINSYKRIYENYSKTIVVGGSGVISNQVLSSLPNPQRFGGNNRYDTNYKINSTIGSINYSLNYDWSHVFFATGADFPDALAGSILASNFNSRIFLVDKGMNLSDIDYRNFLKQYVSSAKMKYILGGTGAVPQNVVDNIINLK